MNRYDKELLFNKLNDLYLFSQNSKDDISFYFEGVKSVFYQFDFYSTDEMNDNPSKNEVKNILLIQLKRIGDNIEASGAIDEVRKIYPNAFITLVCTHKELFIADPNIDELIEINLARYSNFREVLAFIKEHLWNRVYDLSIDFHWAYNEPALVLSLFSGAKQRIGYGSDMPDMYCKDLTCDEAVLDQRTSLDSFFLTDVIANPFDMIHEIDRKYWPLHYLIKKNNIDYKITEHKLKLYIDEDDKDNIEEIIQPYKNKKKIILGIGSRQENRKYPLDLYSEVVDSINEIDDVQFFVIGTKQDLLADTELNEVLPQDNVVDLIDKLTLGETLALINESDIFIGNMSGPMHAASALNKPIIAILRDAISEDNNHPEFFSEYQRFHPFNGICVRPKKPLKDCDRSLVLGHCCKDEAHCITQIDPEEIVQAYEQIM